MMRSGRVWADCYQGCEVVVPSPALELSGPTSTQQNSGVYISASLDPSFLVPAIQWQLHSGVGQLELLLPCVYDGPACHHRVDRRRRPQRAVDRAGRSVTEKQNRESQPAEHATPALFCSGGPATWTRIDGSEDVRQDRERQPARTTGM